MRVSTPGRSVELAGVERAVTEGFRVLSARAWAQRAGTELSRITVGRIYRKLGIR